MLSSLLCFSQFHLTHSFLCVLPHKFHPFVSFAVFLIFYCRSFRFPSIIAFSRVSLVPVACPKCHNLSHSVLGSSETHSLIYGLRSIFYVHTIKIFLATHCFQNCLRVVDNNEVVLINIKRMLLSNGLRIANFEQIVCTKPQ